MRLGLKRVLRTLWIIAGLSFAIWLYVGFQALSVADAAIESDLNVAVVKTDQDLELRPRANSHRSGLILLPGGMVEPLAYAPLLRRLASAGYPTYQMYLPMRCACTESQVRRLFSQIQQVLA